MQEGHARVQGRYQIVVVLLLGIRDGAGVGRFHPQEFGRGTVRRRVAVETLGAAVEPDVLVFFDEAVGPSRGHRQIHQVAVERFDLFRHEREAQDVPDPVDAFHLGDGPALGPGVGGDPDPRSLGPDHFQKEDLHQLGLDDQQHRLDVGGADLVGDLLHALRAERMVEVAGHHLLVGQAGAGHLGLPEEALERLAAVLVVAVHDAHPVPAEVTHDGGHRFGLVLVTGNGAYHHRVAQLVAQVQRRRSAAQLRKKMIKIIRLFIII